MNELAARLNALGEPYAAGFCEEPERSRFYRFALAQARFYESVPLPEYDGGALYPCGRLSLKDATVMPMFSFTFWADIRRLREKDREAAEIFEREQYLNRGVPGPHTVGGNVYTHSIPNYGRVLHEGLNGHRQRIERLSAGDFQDGLTVLLAGIERLRARVLDFLYASGARPELTAALKKVPFEPASSLYEALVCWNFLYYLDGCDNPGRLDQDLFPFYRGEDATAWFREFFVHVDENNGWSSALGPDYNPLTIQCLQAVHGLRRPSFELRVTENMPEEVWQAAIAALATGCGQPALYSEENYQRALAQRFPEIPAQDLLKMNGGGCTETMLAGISNVGSLDAGINLALIFSQVIEARLPQCEDFDSFLEALVTTTCETIDEVLDQVNEARKRRAQYRPQPVRTLLIDDCIERGRDFNDGGARYAWSVVNLAGMVNVIDSLLAVRYAVYEKKLLSAEEMLSALRDADSALEGALKDAPHYGVDDPAADALAAAYVEKILTPFASRECYPSGRFLPSSIQFATYTGAGQCVPATPDGRKAGAPLNDSVGALPGVDRRGPTALLNSVSALPLSSMQGTPVLNLRLRREHLEKSLKPLARAFFARGGMQMQITCQSREDMVAAMAHPEQYGHLIVRIGGYSEYFTRLSRDLQESVLAREEH